jgi:phosphate:Na+ symporter
MQKMRRYHSIFFSSLVLFLGTPALAEQTAVGEFAWAHMAMGLFGGMALLLYGMEQMTKALKAATGGKMKLILAKLTTNRFSGALTGAFVTGVIQSSSVTTVLVVGFVSAGLMTLNQSVGVIMGANIGTTITPQIIAFKVTKLALALIAVGFAVSFFSKLDTLRQYGGMFFGLGLLFFGMNVMGEAMAPLRSYQPFLDLMLGMEKPMLGILIGGAFTALVQSSAATTGIVIVMASQGFITLEGGISLALGANIGTCITALLASIGKPRMAVRAAFIHVLFNVLGVLVWLCFIGQLAQMATVISPAHAELSGQLRLAAETPRQIANAHTLFNIINTLLFIGFAAPMARLATRLLPDRKPSKRKRIIEPKYLNKILIDTPSLGLQMARLEIGHLGEQIEKMLEQARQGLKNRDERLFRELEKQDDAADILYAEINSYLNRVGKLNLTDEESQEYFQLSQAAANFESIGDVLETDLSSVGRKMINENLQPSKTMEAMLADLYESTSLALETAIRAIVENNQRAAQEVIALRGKIDGQIQAALKRQSESLARSDETRLATLNIEFEMIDKLKRIYTLSKRIARLLVPKEV